jgi:thiol-disulfide isomerase/thioredoxin
MLFAARKRSLLVLLLVCAGLAGSTLTSFAQSAGPAPAGGAAARKAEDIQKDLSDTGTALSEIVSGPDVLLDEAKQSSVAPKALPLMRKMSDLYGELAVALPELKPRIVPFQTMLRAMMAMLGEKQANDEIARLSVSADATEATDAKVSAILVRWVKARKEPGVQEKLALELSTLAKAQPQSQTIVETCSLLVEAAATPALAEQIERVLAEDLTSDAAQELGKSVAAKRKLRAIEGKPLTLEGPAVDGTKFSTAQWKGKIVLVDFWATWCGPCRQELPTLKKAYAEYHAKGLEVVGVSCDKDVDQLKAFLSENQDMPWPQMFDPAGAKAGWHPLAKEYGVTSIPTMFLIDKKGVVRSVKAHENYNELIPKLLAE